MKKSYFSYLLRVWPVSDSPDSAWRASLEDPRTGEQMVFASLERLYAFLTDQCALKAPARQNPADTVSSGSAPSFEE